MRSALDNAAPVDHENLISSLNRTEQVSSGRWTHNSVAVFTAVASSRIKMPDGSVPRYRPGGIVRAVADTTSVRGKQSEAALRHTRAFYFTRVVPELAPVPPLAPS